MILVHALKSSALYIGAAQLSEAAKALELAGKEGKVDYIEAHQEEMIAMYHRLLERMLGCELLGLKEEELPQKKLTNIEIEKETLFETLTKIKQYFADFESEGVEEALQEIETYRYRGKPLSILCERLRGKLDNFDFMGAEELVQTAMDEFK